MQVTEQTERRIHIDLSIPEAAVLYSILERTPIAKPPDPPEVRAVMDDLFADLEEIEGVAVVADRYHFSGHVSFDGKDPA